MLRKKVSSSKVRNQSYRSGLSNAPVQKLKPVYSKLLTTKKELPASILCPYLLLMIVRIIALIFTLIWRLRHPNKDAILIWAMSVACELWFAIAWLLDQLPKLRPVKRETDLELLKEKFEKDYIFDKPTSDLPGMDVFVTTADPVKEPPLTTANTLLSILAADYPSVRLSCYLSDDGGSFLTYTAMCKAASFAKLWVPFCRKHNVELRNPDFYFNLIKDPFRNKVHPDFVNDHEIVKRKYNEFKVLINGLPQSEELSKENERSNWDGTWTYPPATEGHTKGDHEAIIKVVLEPGNSDCTDINLSNVDISLPMLVYLSREKHPGYDNNKKAGAMNALVRASGIMSNGAFILNLDCDHYMYNSKAMREAMCFMLDRGGDRICYVQFPQRFDGIDPTDRYANKNVVFFDVIMRCHDGIQGPFYVGTGCVFRRGALYGAEPPITKEYARTLSEYFTYIPQVKKLKKLKTTVEEEQDVNLCADFEGDRDMLLSMYGNSLPLIKSFPNAELQGRPLADHPSVRNGRKPGEVALIGRIVPDEKVIEEARKTIACTFEDGTEWGENIGWIYGSLTEDVLTGYNMHNRGWRSVYCVPKRDAFRGTAPINLTDRLHQVLRWATGSVEIFFSKNNAFFASPKMKFLQRIAYINLATYPFTSIFLTIYCFIPAMSLFSGKYAVQELDPAYLCCLLTITVSLCMLALLEIQWSGITLQDFWRNEQFWLISGVSAHLVAVLQGLLKAVCGLEIKFDVTAKAVTDENEDEFADLYVVKWTSLLIPHIVIMVCNVLGIVVGFTRAAYSPTPIWGSLIGGVFFSFWVLAHLYPFIQGLEGKGGMPGIVYIWTGLITITLSLLFVAETSVIYNNINDNYNFNMTTPVPQRLPSTIR